MNEYKTNIMKVSKQKQINWALNKVHGDIEAIHTAKGISKDKIRKAFDFNVADESTVEAIDSFFEERNALKNKIVA